MPLSCKAGHYVKETEGHLPENSPSRHETRHGELGESCGVSVVAPLLPITELHTKFVQFFGMVSGEISPFALAGSLVSAKCSQRQY